MTARSMLPDTPPDRIRHSWRCPRTDPIAETIRVAPNGQAYVVLLCIGCDHHDLAYRLAKEGGS